ncbi:MAG: prolyl oligopeptidase family serine peptidase [Pseudomonadota bacterium]
MAVDLRPTLDAPDDDPHLWLEEIDGEKAVAWVEQQNARTLEAHANGRYATDREILRAIFDATDKIPYVQRRGDKLYNFWKDETHPRGLWRRTTLESFVSATPDWETVLDVDALAATENEDWIWMGAHVIPRTYDRAMLRLSRGGGDAIVLREFDLKTCTFVDGGFIVPEAKGSASWADPEILLVSSASGEDMATTSGYARTVRRWERGTPFEAAEVVAETDRANMLIYGNACETRTWFTEIVDFFTTRNRVGTPQGPTHDIHLPGHVRLYEVDGHFLAKPREPWTVNDATYAPDTLLGGDFETLLTGDIAPTKLFTPGPRRVLQGLGTWDGTGFILQVLDNLQPRFQRAVPANNGWQIDHLPHMPEFGITNLWALDEDDEDRDGTLCLDAQDPLTPSTLSFFKAGETPGPVKSAPARFNPAGLQIRQFEATSSDGEKIPYTVVGPTTDDGDAPVHLSGYGGFGLPRLAGYSATLGKLWLERGGTTVTAHIRGGGEFGTPWHDAGRNAGKALSHDDFAAVAKDLVDRGITKPERIAAEGGSNGGILITNMLTRYPARFGALFCTIPLIDMRRYTKLLAGASWIAEYGDPDKPEEWDWLSKYSAYHNVEANKNYPPILIATARRDDRVHPGHARKMTAKLEGVGANVWFYEPAAGGHGYGKDNAEQAAFIALGYEFLARNIGWQSADQTQR